MHLTGFPLPVIHHYEMTKETPARLVRVLARTDKAKLKAIPSLSASRIPTLLDAAKLLAVMVRQLGSRSEEHTSALQSLMRISYAVFCLKKKNIDNIQSS